MGQRGPLASGPYHFSDFVLRFSIFQILKFKTATFLIFKIHEILHRDSSKHTEQLYCLAQLQIPKVLHVINSRINLNLNIP
jgi:hypothetical protein